jgi:hypothetical protein
VAPAVEFNASALVSGKASVGYLAFNALDPSVPDFTGMVASVELGYTLLGATRFQFQAKRDIQYSYDARTPYYVLSGLGGSVTQQVADSLGITVRGGRYSMAYRVFGPNSSARFDTLVYYGGGLIRRFSRQLHVSVDADYYRRLSPTVFREYSGLRISSSVVREF